MVLPMRCCVHRFVFYCVGPPKLSIGRSFTFVVGRVKGERGFPSGKCTDVVYSFGRICVLCNSRPVVPRV
jgi:hypothetical protein